MKRIRETDAINVAARATKFMFLECQNRRPQALIELSLKVVV